jgi:hypothetical protein
MVFMDRTTIKVTNGLLESFQAFCFSKNKQINNRQKHNFIKIIS